MHIGTRLGAAGLAAALLLPTGALAAGPDQTQARQEDLDTLYAALQEHHPDLYANTPQEAFEAKKAEIEGRLAEESDVDFALDLQSLVALIGDSHTTTNIGSVLNSTGLYPFGAEWYDGSWVLTGAEEEDAALLGQTVTALNGVPMDEICTRFGTLVSADNPVKLRRQTEQLLYSEACLDYLGIAESGGAFRASCAVTLEEAAQMLVRFVRQQGLTPAEVRSGAPVLASDPAPWASESVAQAWRWGLVAEGADPTGVLTRAQGEALLARLTS